MLPLRSLPPGNYFVLIINIFFHISPIYWGIFDQKSPQKHRLLIGEGIF